MERFGVELVIVEQLFAGAKNIADVPTPVLISTPVSLPVGCPSTECLDSAELSRRCSSSTHRPHTLRCGSV
jgi:hypothetical protein